MNPLCLLKISKKKYDSRGSLSFQDISQVDGSLSNILGGNLQKMSISIFQFFFHSFFSSFTFSPFCRNIFKSFVKISREVIKWKLSWVPLKISEKNRFQGDRYLPIIFLKALDSHMRLNSHLRLYQFKCSHKNFKFQYISSTHYIIHVMA